MIIPASPRALGGRDRGTCHTHAMNSGSGNPPSERASSESARDNGAQQRQGRIPRNPLLVPGLRD